MLLLPCALEVRCPRKSLHTPACSLKMACLVVVRRSSTLLSNRVSGLTRTSPSSGSPSAFSGRDASSIWSGRTGSDLDTAKIFRTCSSTCFCEQPWISVGDWTTDAWMSTIVSFGREEVYFSICFETPSLILAITSA